MRSPLSKKAADAATQRDQSSNHHESQNANNGFTSNSTATKAEAHASSQCTPTVKSVMPSASPIFLTPSNSGNNTSTRTNSPKPSTSWSGMLPASIIVKQEPMEADNVDDEGGIEERGEKRTIIDVDPEYEDVTLHQNKRLRLREHDAKRQAIQKIESIVRHEFSQEMMNKEREALLLDERISETKESLFKLRACLVASYYGKANQESTVLLNRETKADSSIHPTLKKHIGKAPARRQSATNDSAEAEPSGPPRRRSELETDGPETENLSLGKVDPSLKRLSTHASTSGHKETSRGYRYLEEKTIIIGNVSKFIPCEKREENDPSSHKWMLYARGPRDRPDISSFVDKVWFFLHPSYAPNDLVEVNRAPFHLTRRGWGEFPVRVQIHFKDRRNKKIDLIHKLKLDQTYTGLSTLGAETKITASLLINPPEPSAAASSSKPEVKKPKKKVKEEVNVTLNGSQESVVSNIEGHVTIRHEDVESKVKVDASSSSSIVTSSPSRTSSPRVKIKEEPGVKCEPMVTTAQNVTNGLPKSQPISLLKDMSKQNQKDDIFIQCVNSEGNSCFIPQTLFLDSEKSQSGNKIPSPVRKRLNPPGSVSLLNKPRLTVPNTGASQGKIMVTSPQIVTSLGTQGKESVVVSNPVLIQTPKTGARFAISNQVSHSQTKSVASTILPTNVMLSPVRTMTPSVSPSKNVMIPLQISPITSPKGVVGTQPIRLPFIRASSAPLVEGVNPVTSQIAMTSLRQTTVPVATGNALNRITVLNSAPPARPVFQVNLATLGKQLASTATQDTSKPIVTSLLTSQKTSVTPNTVAAQLQAQRKALELQQQQKMVISATPKAGQTATIVNVSPQMLMQSTTKAPSVATPQPVLAPQAQPVRFPQPAKTPQPQLVRANVGGKLVWLQLIPNNTPTKSALPANTVHSLLTTPPVLPSTSAQTLEPESSVFHKVALPRAVPLSRKNPNLGRPPKEERPQPRTIDLRKYESMTSLLRVLVREFPIVSKNLDKCYHPYAARSLREFTLWNVGKKRASERQRASALRARLVSVLGVPPITMVTSTGPGTAAEERGGMFRGERVPSVRQLMDWCRQEGYTPVRVTKTSPGKHPPTDQLSTSLSASDDVIEDLLTAHARRSADDDNDVEIVAIETPSIAPARPVKREPVVPPQPQKNFYMSADERGDFIGDLVNPLGISLQPYPVAPSVYATVVSGMLYKAVRNMVEDVLRTAHSDVYRQGRPDELTAADVHKAISTQPKLDFLTMAGLGSHIDEDPT